MPGIGRCPSITSTCSTSPSAATRCPTPTQDSDPRTSIAQAQAAAAGVTVTVSSGDGGTANTIDSPVRPGRRHGFENGRRLRRSSSRFAQSHSRCVPVRPNNGWLGQQIADFSSAGFAQNLRTHKRISSVPPTRASPCATPNPAIYAVLHERQRRPVADLNVLGGTSEPRPFTAGVAALVIQAYRDTHGGAELRRRTSLVAHLITSTAE